METRHLGKSGLQVSCIGMGCMPLSIRSTRPSSADAVKTLLAAYDAGITFFDTADAYCLDHTEVGHNESLIAQAIKELSGPDKSQFIVATKGGLTRPEGQWGRNGSPEHMRQACEASLQRLGLEAIPLYQHHRIDPEVRLEDTLGELAKLQQEGKILHVGVSNYSVAELERARKIVPVVSVQNEYSPFHPEPEWDAAQHTPGKDPDTAGTLDWCRRNDVAFLPWSPFGGMSRAGRWEKFAEKIQKLSSHQERSPYQWILAWLLSRAPQVIPIPGASKNTSILDCAQAGSWKPPIQDLQTLEKFFREEVP